MGKYAILIVSALIFSMITYSHGLRNALFISNARTVDSYSQNQAHNIAQSAAMMVIRDLRTNPNSFFLPAGNDIVEFPVDGEFENWPDMYGSFRVQVSNQIDQETVTIQSTGRFQESIYITTVRLESDTFSPSFDQALHANNSITMSGNDYVGCGGITPCLVTTNSADANTVNLTGSVQMEADLFVGAGGDPDVVLAGSSADKIDGSVSSQEEDEYYPPPTFPDFNYIFSSTPTANGSYTSSTTLNPEDYNNKYFETIELKGTSSITLNTGTSAEDTLRLRLRSLKLSAQSSIELIGEGKVELYVDQTVEMSGGSSVNEDGDVNNVLLYYQGFNEVDLAEPEQEDFEMGGNTIFNGSLHADQANITLRGTAGIQGNVTTNGNVDIYGDASAISRLIYNPNGSVTAHGNVKIRGAVITNDFLGSGNTSLVYDPEFDAPPPPFEGEILNLVFWN